MALVENGAVEKMGVENSAADISAAAVAESSQRLEIDLNYPPPSPVMRAKDPGVRVRNGRIYDSENGKTCHQCRQKTRDFAAICKKLKNDKPCPLIFCHKCLLNRYGEKADEVGKLEDWICPKCRGVCNCSICMKRKGYRPTGILSHTAKASGFNSVHELLHNKGAEVLELRSVESTLSLKKSSLSNKCSPASKRCYDNENQGAEQIETGPKEEGSGLNEEQSAKTDKKKRAKKLKFSGINEREIPADADGGIVEKGLASADQNSENTDQLDGQARSLRKVRKSKKLARAQEKSSSEDIVLPQGTLLTEVTGIELPDHDVGAALQFLEFCGSFGEVLDIKKGQPECILRDLARGRVKRHGAHSAHVEFNIKLLSLIEKHVKKDGDAWLQTLKRCIEESECILEELPLDFLDMGSLGYDSLEPSEKLKILNFLCDEVLGTEELRKWIDDVATKFDEERKENIEKVIAAKRKEKLLKQKTKEEKTKALLSTDGVTPLSVAEADDLLSELRTEADNARAEVLASLELVPKRNQRSDAVRTDRITLGSNGKMFWKLNGYNSRSNIILQDIGNWDSATTPDKWFVYNEDEEKVVEKYISLLRNPKSTSRRSNDVEEETKSDTMDRPGSEQCLPRVEAEDKGSYGPSHVDKEQAVSCDILPQMPSEQ